MLGWSYDALLNLNKIVKAMDMEPSLFDHGVPEPFKDVVDKYSRDQEIETLNRLRKKYQDE
tara:strand:- start:323 stop:505 length:183 start_codon:yes stop_codon:yes gene_type:complete